MDHSTPSPAAPLPEENPQDTFERVWRRVMPQDRADSPIILFSDLPQAAGGDGADLPAQSLSLSLQTTATPLVERTAPTAEQDVPLLGAASAVYSPMLQQMIDHESLTYRRYRALSRRMTGAAAKAVAAMAADERRHLRRLSAAYFLISGVRYLPPDSALFARVEVTPTGALRRHFADEQRAEAGYRAAAAECSDPCLTSLFLQLAQDEAGHRDLILSLLEQL